MGMLDNVLGQVLGGNKDNAMALKLLQNLVSQQGGITEVFKKLQAGGLGPALASWVGNGDNQAVSADAISNALGADLLSKISGQAGVNNTEASSLLAQYLPNIINQLTPHGKAEDAAKFDLSDGVDMNDIAALASKFLK
ncbi:MAG: DUF937 domain-containing protein [Neisseriaceae bacterium]|nr:DUF937 domain-containing protein [Neisseriaceae bacterium]